MTDECRRGRRIGGGSRDDFADRHGPLGAEIGPYYGGRAVLSYGGPPHLEAILALEGAGVMELPDTDVVEAAGKHAERLLHGVFTQDIRGLAVGETAWSAAINTRGRLIADFRVWRTGERDYLLLCPPGTGEAISGHILHHKVAERIAVRPPAEAVTRLVVVGARACEVLGLGAKPDRVSARSLGGVDLRVAPGHRLGAPAFDVLVPEHRAGDALAALWAAGATPLGASAFDGLRVEAGLPLFGIDAPGHRMPIETGMHLAVSFTKGCYVGQEVIAMATYRGQPNRKLMGVRFERSERLPPAGAPLRCAEDRPVELTTVVSRTPRLGIPAGLALVHHRVARSGVDIWAELPSGSIKGTLCDLPMWKAPGSRE